MQEAVSWHDKEPDLRCVETNARREGFARSCKPTHSKRHDLPREGHDPSPSICNEESGFSGDGVTLTGDPIAYGTTPHDFSLPQSSVALDHVLFFLGVLHNARRVSSTPLEQHATAWLSQRPHHGCPANSPLAIRADRHARRAAGRNPTTFDLRLCFGGPSLVASEIRPCRRKPLLAGLPSTAGHAHVPDARLRSLWQTGRVQNIHRSVSRFGRNCPHPRRDRHRCPRYQRYDQRSGIAATRLAAAFTALVRSALDQTLL